MEFDPFCLSTSTTRFKIEIGRDTFIGPYFSVALYNILETNITFVLILLFTERLIAGHPKVQSNDDRYFAIGIHRQGSPVLVSSAYSSDVKNVMIVSQI